MAKQELQETTIEIGLNSEEVKNVSLNMGITRSLKRKQVFGQGWEKRFWGIVPWMLEATAVVMLVLGKYPQALVVVFLLFFNAGMSL